RNLLLSSMNLIHRLFFFQAEDGIRDRNVTGVQTCAFRSCFLEPRWNFFFTISISCNFRTLVLILGLLIPNSSRISSRFICSSNCIVAYNQPAAGITAYKSIVSAIASITCSLASSNFFWANVSFSFNLSPHYVIISVTNRLEYFYNIVFVLYFSLLYFL